MNNKSNKLDVVYVETYTKQIEETLSFCIYGIFTKFDYGLGYKGSLRANFTKHAEHILWPQCNFN